MRGWKTVSVWNSHQLYMDQWWIPGVGTTHEHTFIHAAADFLADLDGGKKRVPDFSDGLRTQMGRCVKTEFYYRTVDGRCSGMCAMASAILGFRV